MQMVPCACRLHTLLQNQCLQLLVGSVSAACMHDIEAACACFPLVGCPLVCKLPGLLTAEATQQMCHTLAPACCLQAILEWEQKDQERQAAAASVQGGAVQVLTGDEDAPEFVAYVPLPEQKDIELRILEKKKRDLLAKYTSDSLQQEQEQAKAMLNKR